MAYGLTDIMTNLCIIAPFCLETADFILSFLCDCAFVLTLNTGVFAWPPLLFPRGLQQVAKISNRPHLGTM